MMAKDSTTNSTDPTKTSVDPTHPSRKEDTGMRAADDMHHGDHPPSPPNFASPGLTPMRGSQTGPLAELPEYHLAIDPDATHDQIEQKERQALNDASVFGATASALTDNAAAAAAAADQLAHMHRHDAAIQAALAAKEAAERATTMFQQESHDLTLASALEDARQQMLVFDELRHEVAPVRAACTDVATAVTTCEEVTVVERNATIVLHEQVDQQLVRMLDVHIQIDPMDLLQRLGTFLLHIWHLALRIAQVRMVWDQHAMVLGPFLPVHPAF